MSGIEEIIGVLAVAADVIGIASAAAAALAFFSAALLLIVTIIVNVLYFIFLPAILLFHSVIGWVFYDTELFIKDITSSKFDVETPPQRSVMKGMGPIPVLMIFFHEAMMYILEILSIYLLFIAIFPVIIFLAIIVIVVAVLIQYSLPAIFNTAYWISFTAIPLINVFLTNLNLLLAGLPAFAALWNPFVTFLVAFGKLALGILCSGTPYNGDASHDCPLPYGIYLVLKGLGDSFVTILMYLWNMLGVINNLILSSFCPSNVCMSWICQKIFQTETCFADLTFVLRFVFSILSDLLLIWVWTVMCILYFVAASFKLLWQYFGFLVTRSQLFWTLVPASIQKLILNMLNSLAGFPDLAALQVPDNIQPVKDLGLIFLKFETQVMRVVSMIITTLGMLYDAAICNIFLYPIQCFGYKACITVIYDFSVCIPGLPCLPLPLRQWFCINALGVDIDICPQTCDWCAFQPFGIPMTPKPWWDAANRWHMYEGAPYMYAPCDLAGTCCHIAYSMFSRAIS